MCHIFRCLRGRNGWMNNPNSMQFRTTMRKLLLHNFVKASKNGNVSTFEENESASIFCPKAKKRVVVARESSLICNFNMDESKLFLLMESVEISSLQVAVVGYIGGFICRKLLEKLTCHECCAALVRKDTFDHLYSSFCPESLELIWRKDRGGLIVPSQAVIAVVKSCEKAFKVFMLTEGSNLKVSSETHLALKLITLVNRYQTQENVWNLSRHDLQTAQEHADFHSTQLTKEIARQYIHLRLLTHARKFSESVQKNQIGKRQESNRLVIFQHL